MSEINVLSKTQIIIVDPTSSSVSIINAGPIGPGGPTGSGTVNASTVAEAGAVMESDITTALMQFVTDETDLASNSSTKVPTQRAVRQFVLSNAGSGGVTGQIDGGSAFTQSGDLTGTIDGGSALG